MLTGAQNNRHFCLPDRTLFARHAIKEGKILRYKDFVNVERSNRLFETLSSKLKR
jgi:hypothetical protein